MKLLEFIYCHDSKCVRILLHQINSGDGIMALYSPEETYAALIQAILDMIRNPPLCPFTGEISDNPIKIVLGEVGNIWPASILPDVRRSLAFEQVILSERFT